MTEELIQGSPEWLLARCGSFGGSVMSALMAKGEGKTRAKLIRQLAAERLSGVPQGWGGNAATESGHEQEPHGRRAYEERMSCFVEEVGLIKHPRLPNAHASPDGRVMLDKPLGLEIKSHVKFVTHLDAIESAMSKGHNLQCQWGMACTGYDAWDYGHYCHEAPEHLRLWMFPRVMRDSILIVDLERAVSEAELEVAAIVAKYSPRARA